MNADTQPSSNNIPPRGQQCAPGRFRRARVLLAALLTIVIAAAACPLPINAVQQDPGQGTAITRTEGVLQAKGPGKWQVGKLEVLLDDTSVVMQTRGKAEPGAWVIVWGQQSRAGEMRADYIQVDRPASLSSPTIQLSGVLNKQTSTMWMVEDTLIEITPDTSDQRSARSRRAGVGRRAAAGECLACIGGRSARARSRYPDLRV